MSQVLMRLKLLAKNHCCAVLVVHHTRKDGDLTNTDAIGGASAIVNQARVAMMVARMTPDDAKQFKGVLPSELWRYLRIVDAKTNLAPPTGDAQWYQLVSIELPNAEPPTYPHGDSVQVVDKVDPAQLCGSPASSATDDAAKRAILKAAHSANPRFSPSSKGGSPRYILKGVLDAVRKATGVQWSDRDLAKHVDALVREMTGAGWLRVEEVKVAGNPRQGVVVNYGLTPWATDEMGDAARQINQKPFERFDELGTEDIDARRSEGASNVPKGCGDLIDEHFDGASQPGSAAQGGAVIQTDGTTDEVKPALPASSPARASAPVAAGTPATSPAEAHTEAHTEAASAAQALTAPAPSKSALALPVAEYAAPVRPLPDARSSLPEIAAPPTAAETPTSNPADTFVYPDLPSFLDRRSKNPTADATAESGPDQSGI
jgi:hypothetical protein